MEAVDITVCLGNYKDFHTNVTVFRRETIRFIYKEQATLLGEGVCTDTEAGQIHSVCIFDQSPA